MTCKAIKVLYTELELNPKFLISPSQRWSLFVLMLLFLFCIYQKTLPSVLVLFCTDIFFNMLISFYLFIYLFMAVLGLRFCARVFSSCGKRGPLFIAVHRPITIAASPVVEHRLQTLRLSSCGSRAQLLRGMWDLPRPGLEPVSPALAGRFSTTAPPRKPCTDIFNICILYPSLEKYSRLSIV